MERITAFRTARMRQRITYMFILGLLIVTNTTTFLYATRLFNSVETALCKDTRGLELGSFRIDSESKYPPNAQHFNAVREIHQGTRELATRSLIEGKVLKIPRFDISARGESDTLGGPNIIYPLSEDAKGVPGDDRSKISGEGIVGTFHFDNDIRTEMPSAAGKKSGQILADPNDDQSVKGTEGGENATSSNELSDCAPCDCTNSVVTTKVIHQQVEYEHGPNQQQNSHTYLVDVNKNGDPTMKTIFVITPTYHRVTQKIDLNSMCHTLMLVPKVVWIIIEDSKKPTDVVSKLIQRCKVKTVHLVVPTSSAYRVKKGAKNRNMPRGVEQRNAGLHWLRDNYSLDNCSGVFYFGDDDNKYDLRLFEDIRNTRHASVWKVAWAGGLKWEGPTCKNGRANSWHSFFAVKQRAFPLDMAGFAIHLCELFKHPAARVGVDVHRRSSKNGFLESDFLRHFANKSTVECRGSEKETYVWHSHTDSPSLHSEKKAPSNKHVQTD